jgi:nitroimidazol reductase NimA-like FMN-containing flavoprotein (pyridoxamine 5'-phosphate oxidase superfamily)
VSLGDVQDASFASASRATVTSYPPERRLSGPVLDAVLRARRYATVATTRPDGRPHATPTSFVLVGDELWLPTVGGAVRARNVRAQPWLVLVVTEGEGDAHLAVVAEGAVTVVPDADLPADVVAAASERLDGRPGWADAWLVLRPARLLSYAAPGWPGV